MRTMSTPPTEVPDAIGRYLRARDVRDTDAAVSAFHPDGTLRDGLIEGLTIAP